MDLDFLDTPWVSLLLFSLTTMIWTQFDFSVVVEVETVLVCLHYLGLVSTFLKLRYSQPDMHRPFKVCQSEAS